MKTYTITMKDGTQYTHLQPAWWSKFIACCMADDDFGQSVITADDGSWIINVSEIAHVHVAEQMKGNAA
jgi:hypothetical protein